MIVPDTQNTPTLKTVPGSNKSTRFPIPKNKQFDSNIYNALAGNPASHGA